MPAKTYAPLCPARYWNADQSWKHQQELNHVSTSTVVRVTIKVNAYEAQSHGILETFDPIHRKWNTLCSIPGGDLASKTIPYVKRELDQADRNLLLRDSQTLQDRANIILATGFAQAA